jgi:hypothetical protein
MRNLIFALLLLLPAQSGWADVTLGVTSLAAHFSPGNWAGDAGRAGTRDRVTWNNGAWCEWRWTTTSDHPTAVLQISNQTPGSTISYFIDGSLVDSIPVPAEGGIQISDLSGAGSHSLIAVMRSSQQKDRWDDANAFTVTGLALNDGAKPLPASPYRPWVMIVGDSITEGIQAANGADSSLSDYSFLIGQGLRAAGYDTCVSACGYSGWIRHGDAGGDVPGYYAVSVGAYDETQSRWDKIDGRTSLLDADGHLSAYGQTGQEPAAILFNYMVNEALSHADVHDCQASVTGCLAALRKAAPQAWILVLIPPGLEDTRIYPQGAGYIQALKDGVAGYQVAHPADRRTVLIDLGPDVAHALASQPYGGGVHPNAAGHAYLTPIVLQAVLHYLR